MPSLTRIQTRTTRYKARDGRWRAVLLWSDYEWLIKQLTPPATDKPEPWEAVIQFGMSRIPIGRKNSEDTPILVYGDLELALKIAKLLNDSEK